MGAFILQAGVMSPGTIQIHGPPIWDNMLGTHICKQHILEYCQAQPKLKLNSSINLAKLNCGLDQSPTFMVGETTKTW